MVGSCTTFMLCLRNQGWFSNSITSKVKRCNIANTPNLHLPTEYTKGLLPYLMSLAFYCIFPHWLPFYCSGEPSYFPPQVFTCLPRIIFFHLFHGWFFSSLGVSCSQTDLLWLPNLKDIYSLFSSYQPDSCFYRTFNDSIYSFNSFLRNFFLTGV